MRLALKLAGVHAFIIISLAIATWPLPLQGFPWLRYVYFVVLWTDRDFVEMEIQIAQLLGPGANFELIAYTGTFLYVNVIPPCGDIAVVYHRFTHCQNEASDDRRARVNPEQAKKRDASR